MAELAAGVESRISSLFPGMIWKEFPWRDRSPAIPIDLETANSLLNLFPEWAGDWDNFRNAVRKYGGFTTEQFPDASVQDIAQAANDAAQEKMEFRAYRGLVCSGASGTSVSTLPIPVRVPLADGNSDDAPCSWAASKLREIHWRILETCRDKRMTDLATAKSRETITEWIQGGGNKRARGKLSDLRRQFERLGSLGLIKGEEGIGTYITQKGLSALRDRAAQRQEVLRVI